MEYLKKQGFDAFPLNDFAKMRKIWYNNMNLSKYVIKMCCIISLILAVKCYRQFFAFIL